MPGGTSEVSFSPQELWFWSISGKCLRNFPDPWTLFFHFWGQSDIYSGTFLVALTIKSLPAMLSHVVSNTFHFHALEKEMATHSSVLAWRIPGAGEPGGLPSVGSHRVGYDWSDLAAVAAAACNAGDPGLIPGSGRSPGEGNGNPLQYSYLGNPLERGAWWATVHEVTKSQTRLSDWV